VASIAPYSPVADWVGVQTGDHFGNYIDLVSGAAATVTRATPKTIYDPNTGRIHDVPAGSLAVNPWSAYQTGGFGFAPVIEEARTNVFLRSYIPDATALAAWTADAGLTAALGASVHGLYNLSKGAVLTADASNRAFWQQVTATAATWALSCYVKKADLSAVTADDMQLCAVAATTTPVGTLLTTTFAALANGWYRATAAYTVTAPAWTCGVAVKAGKAVTVDCFGVDIGAFATSYIPTTTAAATRNADVVTVPTTGWNAAAGTFVAVVGQTALGSGSTGRIITYAGTSYVDNGVSVFAASPSTAGINTAVSAAFATPSTGSATWPSVVAGKWASGGQQTAYVNGVAATAQTAKNVSGMTNGFIGSTGTGTLLYYNGPISRLTVYPVALTDAQIASSGLTSEMLAGPKSSMAAKLLAIGVL